MFYEREIDIPFDVLDLDGFSYLIPHGLPLEVEPLLGIGIDSINLTNRNVTVGPIDSWSRKKSYDCHPALPSEEFLTIAGTNSTVTRYSTKLLDLLGMTIEALYDFYAVSDRRIMELEPSQLSISKGRLCIGEIPSEQMMVVWTGSDFIVAPSSLKLSAHETAVEEIEGSITGSKFRCKYGMLDIKRK
jgi:hypothetical protein